MEGLKTSEKQIYKENSIDSARKTLDLKPFKINKKYNLYNSVKPADPLINRKKIINNPIKFPSVNRPILKLPNFNNHTTPFTQKFEFITAKESVFFNRNTSNINIHNSKDFSLTNYINLNKVSSRLIYDRNHKDKEGNFTIDNIINLNQINDSTKKSINKNNFYDKTGQLDSFGTISENIVNFESNFECGNLQFVYLINNQDLNNDESNDNISKENNNYQLFLQNDTNTKGHSQWFFFKITKGNKGQKIKLNIMNFQRKKTKYSQGIKIWYFSQKKKEEKRIGWHHTKEEVTYSQNFLYNYIKGKRNYYYTLSFEYTFEYNNDEVYFANCIPFTYSDLINDLNGYTIKENEKYNFFDRKKLCSTITGNDVDYFIINNDTDILNHDKDNTKNKKGIVLFARQHPGETVSSWVLKGAYEFLMGFNEEANYLRDNFIIKIIPMVNVDGVICGNSRTSLAGCDLNRRWLHPDEFLHPEVYNLKELIMNFNNSIKIEYIIDFHGHFDTFNSFFYGNKSKTDNKFCKYFPFICGKLSNIISSDKNSFKMPRFKRGTGRINLYRELNIENIFTLETSYFGCNQGKYINQYFNIDILKEIGRDVCRAILLCNYNSNVKNGIKEINMWLNDNLKNELNKVNDDFYDYISKQICLANQNKEDNKDKETEEENKDISDSESEPSRDNLDEEEIKKLFSISTEPIKEKSKKINRIIRNNNYIKINKIFKLKNKILSVKKNKTATIPKIEKNSQNPSLRNSNDKILTVNTRINFNNRARNINHNNITVKHTSEGKKLKFYKIINTFNANSNRSNNTILKSFEEKQTQTEEIFFISHWSNFFGIYKILSANFGKKRISIGFPLLVKYEKADNTKKIKLKSTGTMITPLLSKINLNENIKNNNKRNNNQIQYLYNSDQDKTEYISSIIIKNDFKKIHTAGLSVDNTKNINLENKMKNRRRSIQKIISSFVSDFTGMKKMDFLSKYLCDDNRITSY